MIMQSRLNLIGGNGFVVEAPVSSVKSIIVWS